MHANVKVALQSNIKESSKWNLLMQSMNFVTIALKIVLKNIWKLEKKTIDGYKILSGSTFENWLLGSR